MGKLLLSTAIASCLFVSTAFADDVDRAVDGVLGGAAGGILLGPIGLVAGAITGVTAGPAISHSWGLDRKSSSRKSRKPEVSPPSADDET